jgi:hypothetical protein
MNILVHSEEVELDPAFLTPTQVMPVLLEEEPHFK